MQLILWRHAEAEDGQDDMSRPLTTAGIAQARVMADWLKPQLPKNLHILSSPAKRTLQTADTLGLPYAILDQLAPGCSPQEILSLVEWPRGDTNVLIVGHQPTLGMVAALAMTGLAHDWSVKKGAVWWMTGRQRNGQSQTVLKFSMSPDSLENISNSRK